MGGLLHEVIVFTPEFGPSLPRSCCLGEIRTQIRRWCLVTKVHRCVVSHNMNPSWTGDRVSRVHACIHELVSRCSIRMCFPCTGILKHTATRAHLNFASQSGPFFNAPLCPRLCEGSLWDLASERQRQWCVCVTARLCSCACLGFSEWLVCQRLQPPPLSSQRMVVCVPDRRESH